jgi:hypothetical protein
MAEFVGCQPRLNNPEIRTSKLPWSVNMQASGMYWNEIWHFSSVGLMRLFRLRGVVLLANFDQGVEIPEEMGDDCGQRCVVAGGPYPSLAMDAG